MAVRREDGWRGVFLRGLARTGNVGLAALKAGVDKQTAYYWRSAEAGFAAAWERAKAWGQARVAAGAGDPEEVAGPVAVRVSKREGAQVVRAGAGRMSERDKGAFLGHLRRTGTAAHAAAAAGFSTTALYNRRKKDPRFAEQWREAKEDGCRRVSLGLLDAAEAALDPERDAAAEGLPVVSVSEAIAILKVHRFDRGDGVAGRRSRGRSFRPPRR
jgi:hypothetical protein